MFRFQLQRLFSVSFIVFTTAAAAQKGVEPELDLVEPVDWTVNATTILIEAAAVENNRIGGTSGTLRLQVWATDTPYNGGMINGFVMGTAVLGELNGGQSFGDISESVPFTEPPAGTFFTTITLEEFRMGAFAIMDFFTFPTTSDFDGPGEIALTPPVSWDVLGDMITIEAAAVENTRPAGFSGTLRLQVWATDTAYMGGVIDGEVIGTAALGQLDAGDSFDNVSETVPFMAPPDGTYFITVTLEEFRDGEFGIVDFVTFNETATFGDGGPIGCASYTGGSGATAWFGDLLLTFGLAIALIVAGANRRFPLSSFRPS